MTLAALEHPNLSFFWTAPVTDTGEITTEDPLGLDYLAQQVGLLLLPTLTTRSTRAQAYATVLYGLSLAKRAVEHYGYPNTEERKRELFERWERFWALATLEFRGGELPRGDWDAMRGVRGARAAWKPTGDLPLDFALISRQQELGNLGAYLAPLRRAGLVVDGGVRPTPAADEILEGFWDEPGSNKRVSQYEAYSLAALDLGQKRIARKHGTLTLAKLGERSRLLSLIELRREPQQKRLYSALFGPARDKNTLAVAQLVEAAAKANIVEPRGILTAAIEGDLDTAVPAVGEQPLRELLVTSRAFGDFMKELTAAFDRVYATIHGGGWRVPRHEVTARAFSPDHLGAVQEASKRLIDAPSAAEIRSFPMHGAPCLRLAESLATADPEAALRLLLGYHASVQGKRLRGAGWIHDEGEKLVLHVTSYTPRPDTPRFPSFKLDAVRTLLTDMGRLPFRSDLTPAEVEP